MISLYTNIIQTSKNGATDGDLPRPVYRRGIAFGFVGSHRDRKSSSPDYERNERAKKFFLCSPF